MAQLPHHQGHFWPALPCGEWLQGHSVSGRRGFRITAGLWHRRGGSSSVSGGCNAPFDGFQPSSTLHCTPSLPPPPFPPVAPWALAGQSCAW